eukprot:TRINITY_DN7582_c0_g1_i1.p1 TRINITY_DN7582_c0_g1~~TRINITY_DN7582_c0_g1_i1.p1  ORF type:complete len:276 (+),score=34.15 TRINITY_DN7582_c0_g1_i1:118-945(+)
MKGCILRWVPDRGFGFIAVEGEGEVFFHKSACDPRLEIETGVEVQCNVVIGDNGKKKATQIRKSGTPITISTPKSQKSILFDPVGKVTGVAVFLLANNKDNELCVLLGYSPKRSCWESSGYYAEISEKCKFSDTSPSTGAIDTSISHTANNPSSNAVQRLQELYLPPELRMSAETRFISIFHSPSATGCFQSSFVFLPSYTCCCSPDGVIEVAGPASLSYSHLRWFTLSSVISKSTCEKTLQHTEQRINYLRTNRRVQATLGVDLSNICKDGGVT